MTPMIATLVLLGALLDLGPQRPLAFGAEIPIGPAELAPSRFTMGAHLATSGEMYVAVWTDYRSFPGATYASRFRADGTRLDRVGIRVAADSRAGAVLWNGSAFLIAYQHAGMITVCTLSPDGVLGEPIELFATDNVETSFRMRLATNGDSVLLVTADSNGALLDPDGRERREIAFPWSFAQNGLGVAAAGSTYLVAAGRHNNELKTQMVMADGELGASHVLMDTVRFGVDVASDGERFLVAWARGNLYAQFITGEGAPVEAPMALTALHPVFASSHSVTRLIRRGGEFLLLYTADGGAPYDTLRLGDDGGKRGPLLTGGYGPIADVASHDGGGAVVGTHTEVLSAAFFDAGAPTALRNATPAALAGRAQSQIRLARIDGGFVAAWRGENDVPELLLSRGPGSTPVLVVADYASLIDVVVEDGVIWVLWTAWEHVHARRFTTALEAIDAQPVVVAQNDNTDYAAAAGGGAVVLVRNHLHHGGAEPAGPDIEAQVLRATATGIDVTTTEIASLDGFDRLPAVAWTGDAFLVAWANATDYYPPLRTIRVDDVSTPYKPDDRILAVRMTATGELLDADPLEVARSKSLHALSIVDTTLAWQTYETPNFSSRRHTYAARAVANAPVVDLGGEDTYFGAFTADDGGYLLTRAGQLDSTTLQPEIVRIDASLTVTETIQLQPITVNFIYPPPNPFDVDLIGGPLRTIGYSRIAGADYGHTRRIFVRRLAETHRRRALR